MFILKPFSQLSCLELYQILQLRVNVFVVEQNCPYSEIDGKDITALHLFAKQDDVVIAYARILPSDDNLPKIGRVVVHQDYRNRNLGKQLMTTAIFECNQRFGGDIHISAQSYLKKFYKNLGFVAISDEYLEDGIPHIDMQLKMQQNF